MCPGDLKKEETRWWFCARQTVSGFIVDEKVEEYKNQKSFLFEVNSMNFDGAFVNSIRKICFVGEIDSDLFKFAI